MIIDSILEGTGSILRYFIIEIVIELLIRGLGIIITKPFSRKVNSEGWSVLVVGVIGWSIIIASGIWIFQ